MAFGLIIVCADPESPQPHPRFTPRHRHVVPGFR